MSRSVSYPLQRESSGLPRIDQGLVHGWPVSWNPDDYRFYVERHDERGVAVSTHADWRNCVQWCRRNKGEIS